MLSNQLWREKMAKTMISKELMEPFLEHGIRDTNFFNGRLLTANDLTILQEAGRRRDRQLGLGIGAGIVAGLEVRLLHDGGDGRPPTLAVSKGLAFNRMGQAAALAQKVEVRLAKEKPTSASNGKTAFAVCLPPQQQGKPLPGKGAYLFVARPAAGYRGHAPRRGFGQATKVEDCDRDLLWEGVQFRLVSLDVTTLDKLSMATRNALTQLLQDADKSGLAGLQAQSKLRNWLAHVCYGTEELAAWPRDPLARIADDFFGTAVHSPYNSYGALDALRDKQLLDDCDVPLALLCWTATGVKWVDMWAARRRPVRRPLSTAWPLLLSERRIAEGEAVFQQFHEQAALLTRPETTRAQLMQIEVRNYFRYLPAAGIIPFTTGVANRGFDYLKFFNGLTIRDPVFIEGMKAFPLFHLSWAYPPIDLVQKELIWLYLVRENREMTSAPQPQPYLIFTSGYVPYQDDAQFDLSRWQYSNYGPGLVAFRSFNDMG
jgi:hypothetical protein